MCQKNFDETVILWDRQFGSAQFVRVKTFQFFGHLSILKIDTLKVKIDTFKIKIEKCLENEKMSKLLHAQIGPTQIDGLIMRPSLLRPTVNEFEY